MKIYLDEAGNTGKNLIDAKQPFLTLGAILIKDSKLASLAEYFSTLPSDLKDENGEIKGNNIACYNQDLVLEVISEKIPEYSEGFFFNVVEKKFMIAGKIVDNFFDPQYNEKTNYLWTHKSDFRIRLANFFYETLSDDTIKLSYNAFISKNIDNAKQALESIIDEIKEIPYEFNIVDIISGVENNLASLISDINSTNLKNSLAKGIPKNTISTPNVTAFTEIIGRMERYLESMNCPSTLVFDDSEQYNKIFETLLKIFIKAPKKEIPISPTETFRVGFEYLRDYSVKSSDGSVGLQLADILASSINHIFVKILTKEDSELTLEDKKLVLLLFGIIYGSDFGYLTVSKKTSERIGYILKTTNA